MPASVFLLAAVLLAPTANAATAPTPISTAQFALSADYHRYDALNSDLDASLPNVTVSDVMHQANLNRQPLCHTSGLTGPVTGF